MFSFRFQGDDMKAIAATAIAAMTCFALSGLGQAQTPSAAPTYGEVSLSAGFTPDPYRVDLMSGGPVNSAERLGGNCPGFIADAPDFDLYYNAGSLPLILSVHARSDTTLVVHAPDGQWYCDDDSGAGVNPKLRFAAPQSGLYDIWIGSYDPGSNAPAQLKISELDR